MRDYTVFTDSSCDLSENCLANRNVKCPRLTLKFESCDRQYLDGELEAKYFYDSLRLGDIAKTSSVNAETFENAFEEELIHGRDILYLGISSALSGTFSAALTSARKLLKKYPNSKIITVDTLCASAGIALLLDLVLEKKSNGATIDEAADFAEKCKSKICHWFTIDNPVYLVRSGRVKPSKAFIGNMLGIKPILAVDDSGHLVAKQRVRGRHQSVMTLAEKCRDFCLDSHKYAYISHADCISDAEKLKEKLKEYNIETKLITNVGAVIGAHSGPDTLALFFLGDSR